LVAEHPHVFVVELQMLLQHRPGAEHGAPSGLHTPQIFELPVSRHWSPGQQSGPYRKSSPEHGAPAPEHPQ
jgi:hypothetical protein